MPGKHPLANSCYYHVMNRGVEKRDIFIDNTDYSHFFTTLSYYRYNAPPVKLSTYLESPKDIREIYNRKLIQQDRCVTVFAYCLMSNHFHLLLRQETDNGITKYLHKLSDSYTKYFNKRYTRVGSLFQGTFKSVLIESDEEFLHVSRYIHLNSSSLSYPWSSAQYYFSDKKSFINTTEILSHFDNKEKYKEFIEEQRGYQRTLAALRSDHFQD